MKKIYLLLMFLLILPLVSALGSWNGTLLSTYTDSSGDGNIDNPVDFYLKGNALIISAVTGDSFTILNVSNPVSISVINTTTNSANPYSLDGARGFDIDDRNIMYICASADDTLSLYNMTSLSAPVGISDISKSAIPFSLDNCWGVKSVKRGTQYYVFVTSYDDDEFSVYNVTNPLVPVAIGNYSNSGATCSIDGGTSISLDETNNRVFVTATADNTITTLNVTNLASITCLSTYTDIISPYSIQQASVDVYGKYLYNGNMYTIGFDDNEFSIFNISSDGALTGTGSYVNDTLWTAYSLYNATSVFISDYMAYVVRRGANVNGGIVVFNVSNINSPVPFAYLNSTSGSAVQNFAKRVMVDNTTNTLYELSGNDDSLYIFRTFNNETVPVTDQCIYGGTGNFVQNNTICNITSNVSVQTGFNWIIQNSTVWTRNGVKVSNFKVAQWLSGILHMVSN